MTKPISEQDRLSLTFTALANPTRRKMLSLLKLKEYSVKDLAEPFDMTMAAISKLIKILERAGLITKTRDAQIKRSKLEIGPLKEVDDWIEEYRQFWNQSFDKLEGYLDQLKQQKESNKDGKNTHNRK